MTDRTIQCKFYIHLTVFVTVTTSNGVASVAVAATMKPSDAGVSFVEGINYFCDLQLEKYLEKIRGVETAEAAPKDARNTVLVLPRVTT